MKSFLLFVWEVLKIAILAFVIVIPIRYFLFQPFFVLGQSMEPNFENGDYLLVDEISYRLGSPQRGDVIVFRYPGDPSQRYIKRVIGLPGETVEIENGQVVISKGGKDQTLNESAYLPALLETSGNISVTLGPNEYFVLGDNRPFSSDSRRWGILPRQNIIGKVFLRAWPLAEFSQIKAPSYQ